MGSGDGSDVTRHEQNSGRASSDPSRLSITARIQAAEAELWRFVLQEGLCDDDGCKSDDHDVDTRVRRREDEPRWWCRHQFVFPSLARLAVKYLVIPPSLAASERIFSIAGNIVIKKRHDSEMIQSMRLFSCTVRTGWLGTAGFRSKPSAGPKNDLSIRWLCSRLWFWIAALLWWRSGVCYCCC